MPRTCKRGFSLLELLVTLVVIGLFMGLILPRFGTSSDKYQLKSFADQFNSALAFLQQSAITQHREYHLHIDLTDQTISERSGALREPVPLPPNMTFYQVNPANQLLILTIYPDGSFSNSEIVFSYKSRILRFNLADNPQGLAYEIS